MQKFCFIAALLHESSDRLNGGAGNDTLTGGASIDGFIFKTNQEFVASAVGIDLITDFDLQQDLILLDKTTFSVSNLKNLPL